MSIKLLSAVWDYNTTGNERAVLQVLCDYANDDGICWPSIGSIAWKVGCTEQTVRNVMAALYSKGALVRLEDGGGRNKTNKYRVILDELEPKTPRELNPQTDDDKPSKPSKQNPQNPQILEETPKQLFEGNRHREPSVLEPSDIAAPKKTRTPSGPAQEIVAAYCQKAGIERPVSYGQAVGLAQKMADAGIVPADISSLYDYVSSWATGVDMTLMFKQADSWRASRTTKPVAKSTSRWSREEELAARSGYALLNMGGDE